MTVNRSTKIPDSMKPEPYDPKYQALRAEWWKQVDEAVKAGRSRYDFVPFILINRELEDYQWAKVQAICAEDRRKHPRAKRNRTEPLPTDKTAKAEVPNIPGLTA